LIKEAFLACALALHPVSFTHDDGGTATGNQLTKKYQITPRGTSKQVPTGLKLHDLVGDGRIFETGEDIPF
jgi:hypothetical protein